MAEEEMEEGSSGHEEEPGSLKSQLRQHSSHFSAMVELIPAKYYVMKEDSGDATPPPQDSKYWVKKNKKKHQKEAVKDLTKKAKRLKLDPESQKSVADLQAEQLSLQKQEAETKREDDPKAGQEGSSISVEKIQSVSLSDLQERLKDKIETLRQKRKAPSDTTSEAAILKRQKRTEKKQRKKELRKKKKLVSGKVVTDTTKEAIGQPSPSRPFIKDKQTGKLVFSKFDFTTPIREEEKEPISKTGKKKDYKVLLAKAEASRKKLEELKKKDEKRGEELEKKLQWQKALDMARGTKLKDNPKLLKKSVKRLEKKKQKSSKQWEERKEMERQAKERRQEKRKKNIQERAEKVKEAKKKRRAKRVGRIKPGF